MFFGPVAVLGTALTQSGPPGPLAINQSLYKTLNFDPPKFVLLGRLVLDRRRSARIARVAGLGRVGGGEDAR